MGNNNAANKGLIPIPANSRSRATSTLPWKYKVAAASTNTTGTAMISHFSHGREQIARASHLPSRSNLASAEVNST